MTEWDSIQTVTRAMLDTMRAYEKTGIAPWTARIALRDLVYQAGGLMKLDMQLHGERHLQGRTKEDILKDIEVELAEIVAVALFAAHELNLDISEGFQRMVKSDQDKIACRSRDL